MPLKGNKGEWSEVYVLLKLLGDGKVYSGNQQLNKIIDLFYPILKVIRKEHERNAEFSVESGIVLVSDDGLRVGTVRIPEFLDMSKELLAAIKQGRGSFHVPSVQPFLDRLHVTQIKASTNDKADIKIVIHDLRTGANPLLGFSIKSKLGGSSTLLNASAATNFEYKVTGHDFSDAEIEGINEINTRCKILDRMKAIRSLGGRLAFQTTANPTFKNNMTLIDSSLPHLIAELLVDSYSTGESRVEKLVEMLTKRNPLGFDMSSGHPYYVYKVKQFLVDVALGMIPSKRWDGHYEANGGYLVVKEDGEVLCYHFYDRNLFEEYMFHNTKLERPSTMRHHFASLYRKDGECHFKLNLQIRFL